MSRIQSPLQSTGVFSPPESEEERRARVLQAILSSQANVPSGQDEFAPFPDEGLQTSPINTLPPLSLLRRPGSSPEQFRADQDKAILEAQALKAAARTATLQNRVGMTGVLPEGLMQIIPGDLDRLPDGGPSGIPSPAPGAFQPAAVDAPQLGGSIAPPPAFVSAGQAADPRADAAGDTIVNQQSQATQDLLNTLRAMPKIGDKIAAQHEMFGPPTLPPELLAQIEQEGLANQGIERVPGGDGAIQRVGKGRVAEIAGADPNFLQRNTAGDILRLRQKGFLNRRPVEAAQRPFGIPSDDSKADAKAAFLAREEAAGRRGPEGGAAAPKFNTFKKREDEQVEEAFGDAAGEQQGGRQGGINIRRLVRIGEGGKRVARTADDQLSLQLGATDQNLGDAQLMAERINERTKNRKEGITASARNNRLRDLTPEARAVIDAQEGFQANGRPRDFGGDESGDAQRRAIARSLRGDGRHREAKVMEDQLNLDREVKRGNERIAKLERSADLLNRTKAAAAAWMELEPEERKRMNDPLNAKEKSEWWATYGIKPHGTDYADSPDEKKPAADARHGPLAKPKEVTSYVNGLLKPGVKKPSKADFKAEMIRLGERNSRTPEQIRELTKLYGVKVYGKSFTDRKHPLFKPRGPGLIPGRVPPAFAPPGMIGV